MALHDFIDQLVSAAAAGDLRTITTLFEKWKRRNLKAEKERLQLILEAATRTKQLDVISYLLSKKACISRVVTLLAVHIQSTEALEIFLAHGWDINNRWYPYTMPTISEAIALNDLELVKWFLSHGATPCLTPTNFTCRTPLTYAVGCASIEIVKLLVTYGAELDRGNLLHELCESNYPGRLEVLGYLVWQGAPINQIEEVSDVRLFEVTEQFGIGAPLHNAVRHNNPVIALALLGHGANRTVKDSKGRTPLDWAKELGSARMIELLEPKRLSISRIKSNISRASK